MQSFTIEEFKKIHQTWKESGLSVRDYCANTGSNQLYDIGAAPCHVLTFEYFQIPLVSSLLINWDYNLSNDVRQA